VDSRLNGLIKRRAVLSLYRFSERDERVFTDRGVARGSVNANDPLFGEKIFEIDRENPGFRGKRLRNPLLT
jgi:hypothetical protein